MTYQTINNDLCFIVVQLGMINICDKKMKATEMEAKCAHARCGIAGDWRYR